MPKLSQKRGDFISQSRILIENTRNSPEILSAVAVYGYDVAKLNAGAKLLNEVDALSIAQAKVYGEAYEATELMHKAWEASSKSYSKALKIARLEFGNEVKAIEALRLAGPRKEAVGAWLDQAQPFYGNLLGDKTLGDRMAQYGYDRTKLLGEQALVMKVQKLKEAQLLQNGQAKEATKIRDQKLAETTSWLSIFRGVLRVALDDDQQQLEKVGIVVLNAPRAKRKNAKA